jgi:hypothetical protein
LLPKIAEITAASAALVGICGSLSTVSQPVAIKMLSVLFGALSKRKADASDENAAMLLAATADMFDPVSRSIGATTGLWKSIPAHPVVLALAIKQMLAKQVFQPAPAEVLEAMERARERIGYLMGWTLQALQLACRADAIVFEFDRPAWDATYTGIGSEVAQAILDQLDGEAPGEDDDGPVPGSPRWLALDALRQAKAAEAKPRLAACRATGPSRVIRSKPKA